MTITNLFKQFSDDVWKLDDDEFSIYNVYWGRLKASDYIKIEKELATSIIETDYYNLYLHYDMSGFNYWKVREKDTNYCDLHIYLKQQIPETEIALLLERIKTYRNYMDTLEETSRDYIDWVNTQKLIDDDYNTYEKARYEAIKKV